MILPSSSLTLETPGGVGVRKEGAYSVSDSRLLL